MLLTLSVKNHQRKTTHFPEEHHFSHTGGSIGRDNSNDWALPDQNNFLSKKHASILFNENHFYIIDNSTNGIFINHSHTPLGRGNQHKIQASDEIIMGEYTLIVSQLDESVEDIPFPLHDSFTPFKQTETASFALETTHDHDPFDQIFNPTQEEEPYRHAVDTTANSHNAFFFDEKDNIANDTEHPPEKTHENNNKDDRKNKSHDLFLDPTIPSAKDNNPLPKIPRPLEIQNIDNTDDSLVLNTEKKEKPENIIPEEVSIEPNKDKTLTIDTNNTDPLTQILLSAGLSVDDISRIQPTEETYQLIGHVLKASIDGTMNLLRSRTEAKNHLHLDNTLISPRENNPLKFLPNAHFVLKQTLSSSSNHSDDTYLTLADALNEAYDDISAHEYSMATSIQEALTATIKKHFAPNSLQKKLEKDRPISSRIPLKREANLWKLFTSIYDDIAEEASESFQVLLDKEIVNAYEIQMKRLKEKRQKKTP